MSHHHENFQEIILFLNMPKMSYLGSEAQILIYTGYWVVLNQTPFLSLADHYSTGHHCYNEPRTRSKYLEKIENWISPKGAFLLSLLPPEIQYNNNLLSIYIVLVIIYTLEII